MNPPQTLHLVKQTCRGKKKTKTTQLQLEALDGISALLHYYTKLPQTVDEENPIIVFILDVLWFHFHKRVLQNKHV